MRVPFEMGARPIIRLLVAALISMQSFQGWDRVVNADWLSVFSVVLFLISARVLWDLLFAVLTPNCIRGYPMD
ncbi:hypothetical protein V6x_02210 [Gimesia chilikensis]|uniref:Uncharacterized protein n=1 Tax=Gimesia chilikensis TaxID=2605989 RepID=A0A517W5L8_9PLAN|nr:hypothetical protein V6x_02210 [Gimesia chilikensis]